MEDNGQPQAHEHQFLDYPDGRHCPCGEVAPGGDSGPEISADAMPEPGPTSEEPVTPDAVPSTEMPEAGGEEPVPTEEVAATEAGVPVEETPVAEVEAETAVTPEIDPVSGYFDSILGDLERIRVSLTSFKDQNPDTGSEDVEFSVHSIEIARAHLQNVARAVLV